MAKTYRRLQQWDRWLSHQPGKKLLTAEQKFLPSILTQHYGSQAVLIGSPQQQHLLKGSVIPNQLFISPLASHSHQINMRSIESELYELPIASGSADLVLLPHTLEALDNPRKLLAEACRIVKPEGHIIICGFNPYSFWGLKRFLSTKDNTLAGNHIKCTAIKKWLSLADFKLVKQSMILYRPPLKHDGLYKKLQFLEWLGQKIWPSLGGVYILVAQAKVIPLTPIKMRWQQKLTGVRFPTIGLAGPPIRNHLR